MLGRDALEEGWRGAAAAISPEVTRTEEGRARFWTVSWVGCEGLVDVGGAIEGRGRVLPTVLLRLSPVVEDEAAGLGAGSPVIIDSLARLAAVWRTLGVFFSVLGTGRALKAGFFSSIDALALDLEAAAAASRFSLSSRAAFSFAATASPGSWNELLVGALELLAAGGGVGNESETGRGLL
jgi:hypothetical protein